MSEDLLSVLIYNISNAISSVIHRYDGFLKHWHGRISDLSLVMTVKLCVESVISPTFTNLYLRSTVDTGQESVIRVRINLSQTMILLIRCSQDLFIAINTVTWSTDVLLSAVFIIVLIWSKTGTSV